MHVYNNQLSPEKWAGSGITSMDHKSTGTGVSVSAYLCMRRMQLPSGGALRTAVPPISWCHGLNKTISFFQWLSMLPGVLFPSHLSAAPFRPTLPLSSTWCSPNPAEFSFHIQSLVAFCIYRADEADYTFQTLFTPLCWTEKNLVNQNPQNSKPSFSPLILPFVPAWGYPNHAHRQ